MADHVADGDQPGNEDAGQNPPREDRPVQDQTNGATDRLSCQVQRQVREMKDQQKTHRKHITDTLKKLYNMMHNCKSRHKMEALLAEAQRYMGKATECHDFLRVALPAAEKEKQLDRHLEYVMALADATGHLAEHLERRQDEAPSVISRASQKQKHPPPPANAETTAGPARPRRTLAFDLPQETPRPPPVLLPVAGPRMRPAEPWLTPAAGTSARSSPNASSTDSDEDLHDLEDAQHAYTMQDLSLEATRGSDSRVREWFATHQQQQTTEDQLHQDEDRNYQGEPAPDDWIDSYAQMKQHKTNLTARLDAYPRPRLNPFSGQSLEWFAWIGRFRALVHCTSLRPEEKLDILQESLAGEARFRVSGLGGGEAAYKQALVRLKKAYGGRGVMRAALKAAMAELKVPVDDPAGFQRYADRVRTYLFDLSQIRETASDEIIDGVCQRLQKEDRLAWNTERRRLEQSTEHPLNRFGDWLCDRAAAYLTDETVAAAQRAAARNRQQQQTRPDGGRPGHRQARTHAVTTNAPAATPSSGPQRPPYCFKCCGQHRLSVCPVFAACSLEDRLTFITEHRLCQCCFGIRHKQQDCRYKKACEVNGCRETHHPLLHGVRPAPSPGSTGRVLTSAADDSKYVALGLVRVNVVAADGHLVPANVLLDEGSDTTLIREGLARQLQIDGEDHTLNIVGVAGKETRTESKRVQLQVQVAPGDTLSVTGATLPSITRPSPVYEWEKLRTKFQHLTDLPLTTSGGRVDILLGVDHAHLLAVEESRSNGPGEPVASLTKLGWVVRGVLGIDEAVPTRVLTVVAAGDLYANLDHQMKRLCDSESFGTEVTTPYVSEEDRQALALVKEGTNKLPVGYETPVIWAPGEPRLPDNRPMAENRLRGLVRQFEKDPAYESGCRESMEKVFSEGYAVRLTPEEASDDRGAYYLPVFGVRKRAGSKVRMVFDAAARYQNRCLNDCVLTGPTLQNPLPLVLTRFRENEVAWVADIQAMFSRIRLKAEDWRRHRFLWPERDGTITVGEMRRVTFGVACSPFVAIHTTWRAAEDVGPDYKDAADAIKRDVYVDDVLGSAEDEETAIQLTRDITAALAHGDFHLAGWRSNSSALLQAMEPGLPHETGAQETSCIGADDADLVLGIVWRPRDDTLGFKTEGAGPETRYTRIGLASKAATVFDPLGFAAPLTVKAKVRLRELCVRGLNWHDEVSEEDREWWSQWLQTLQLLETFVVPRCLFPRARQAIRVELHTFGDASEEAFAAVTYTRAVYEDGVIEVRLVKASTKLSPAKRVSINKLELNAAVLATRQARFVGDGLKRTIDARRFWTDSSTVRNWIRAKASCYEVYVGNRIGEIQAASEPSEWRFVPGRNNPADAATRAKLTEDPIPMCWREGPEFLRKTENHWPPDVPWIAVTDGVRPARVHQVSTEPPFDWNQVIILPEDIPRLVSLDLVYRQLIHRCQEEAFADDIRRLKAREEVSATSRLLTLSPLLDQNGLVRLGGRLGKAALPYHQIHPIILPGRHPLCTKIIESFHLRLQHAGTEFTLAQIRLHFWLLQGREAVKKVKRGCVECRKRDARPVTQMMGEVPTSRLAEGAPPFSCTAVDYFGPLETTYGRNRVKKMWGALFTCLTTRAVYLDLSPSLSADDFLLILRRFISLYGKPAKIHSDNGTNFIGAERELREIVEQLHRDPAANRFMEQRRIQWDFQPARTPHFGGAHEALVKSVKSALYSALDQESQLARHPTEDVLRTLLFEIAGLLNTRPLTFVGTDPDDYRPLTPSDFLNRPPSQDLAVLPLQDASPRQLFRYVQRMRTVFWDMWRSQYLPSLAARSKWKRPKRNLEIGDVVMEAVRGTEQSPWKIGRVIQAYPGSDGLVRVVDVKAETGVYRRGVHRLVLLEPSSPVSSPSPETGSGADGSA